MIKNYANRGRATEDMLNLAHQSMAVRGIAWIRKIPTPIKVLRPLGAGKFLAVFSASAGADYVGTLEGGRAVVVEAKELKKGPSLPARRFTGAEVDHLTNTMEAGGLAIVFVRRVIDGSLWAIPWSEYSAILATGRKSMNLDKAPEFRVAKVIDYIEESLKWEEQD